MPNLSQRITKAAEESAQANRRIAAAEAKIARAILDMLRADDEPDETPPPLPPKPKTPPNTQPPKR
jgi:hypothetical protein